MKTKEEVIEAALKRLEEQGITQVCVDPLRRTYFPVNDSEFEGLVDNVVGETIYWETAFL